jgi:adenine-specific DNA-methyltransferase
MSYERLKPTFTLDADKIEQLRQIVPEAFADGKINWETLKHALGDQLEDEGADAEHFGLFWPGKREARRMAAISSKGTLVPVPGEGIDEETTRNIFIEGENLEVLKLLQKSYAGRIKMIYIDPPYNTGNDFVYEDDFRDPLEEYLRRTGQVDEEGKPLTTNTRADGRFHSKWLNMMFPRLKIARSLLRDEGVMFVSIDDNEVHNLRQILNEVFGEENFVVQIAWQSRQSVQNDTDISVNHEYIVCYAKVRRQIERRLKESNASKWYAMPGFAAYPLPLDPSKFSNPDGDPRGPWKADPFDAPAVRENLAYFIVNPKTGEKHLPPPGRHWRTEETNYKRLFDDKRILFGKTGVSRPQLKVFYEEKKQFGEVENTWFDGSSHGTATHGTKEIQELFDGTAIFESPKPTSLISSLMRISTKDSD